MAKKAALENEMMEKIVSLCKRRGFVFPGSEIYGGLANSWDYGPLGVELKNNVKQMWWRFFVTGREDMVGIDAALIMNPRVWEASGHLSAGFADPLVECKKCHARYRADHISVAEPCESCGAKDQFTEARMFNQMLKTFLGPAEGAENVAYLRPETAQAMFVDFKQVAETTRKRLPFGIAQQGKAFRNEITPGNFIFRTREFEQMEIEYFVRAEDWENQFERWLGEMKIWLTMLGVKANHLHFVEIAEADRAFYSKRTVDIEYDYPFGQKELYGLAYRTDYDLSQHEKGSGAELKYVNPDDQKEKIIPHVIEPSFGVDRSILVALLEAYTEENVGAAGEGETDTRIVMKFPYWLAPIKVAVLPLSKKEELAGPAKKIATDLRAAGLVVEYDETQSIGKRYRRQDEIGTPFCVTIDFDSLNDNAVTVRERDSMAQTRLPIAELVNHLRAALQK